MTPLAKRLFSGVLTASALHTARRSLHSDGRWGAKRIWTQFDGPISLDIESKKVAVRTWWEEAVYIHVSMDPSAQASGTADADLVTGKETSGDGRILNERVTVSPLGSDKTKGTKIRCVSGPHPIAEKVTVYLPQNASIGLRSSGSVQVTGKVEGSLRILAQDGDIDVDRVQGKATRLDAPLGSVKARSLEGQVVRVVGAKGIEIARVFARRFVSHADDGSLAVQSLYADNACLDARDALVLNLAHVATLQGSVSGKQARIECPALHGSASLHSLDGPIHVALLDSQNSPAGALLSLNSRMGDVNVGLLKDYAGASDITASSIEIAPEFQAVGKWDPAQPISVLDPNLAPFDSDVDGPSVVEKEHIGTLNGGSGSRLHIHTRGAVRITPKDWENTLKLRMMVERRATRSKATDL